VTINFVFFLFTAPNLLEERLDIAEQWSQQMPTATE